MPTFTVEGSVSVCFAFTQTIEAESEEEARQKSREFAERGPHEVDDIADYMVTGFDIDSVEEDEE